MLLREEAPSHAGLIVSSGDIACDTVNGRFSVLELETLATDLHVRGN